MEKTLEKIAVLIDADNTQLAKLESVMNEISTYGRIVVKKAYGNWKKDTLKNWEDSLKNLAIKPEQQFDYVPGKNATDMALTIDAMDMLYKNLYDGFAIVSSDSDFTPLAQKIMETGVHVIGVGEKKTPSPFINACENFIYLENLSESISYDIPHKQNDAPDDPCTTEIHGLLKIAFNKWQNDEGFVNMGSAGSYIKRAKPDFNSSNYGFSTLTKLIEHYPNLYEIKKVESNYGNSIVYYRCK